MEKQQELINKLVKFMWDKGHEVNPNHIKLVIEDYTKLRKEELLTSCKYEEVGLGEVVLSKRKNSPGFKSDNEFTAKVKVNLDSRFKDELVAKVNLDN